MGQTKKDAKGNAVADLLFDSFIGKIINGFEDEDFEHQDFIEGGASTLGGVFVFSDFAEDGSKQFPVDEGVEVRQKVVEFVDFCQLLFQIKEAVLSGACAHGNSVPKSKKRSSEKNYSILRDALLQSNCSAKEVEVR